MTPEIYPRKAFSIRESEDCILVVFKTPGGYFENSYTVVHINETGALVHIFNDHDAKLFYPEACKALNKWPL